MQIGARLFEGPGPFLMGIVNTTPDSFSDGGRFADADAAVEQALLLQAQGADLVDVGGESTRPGAPPVSAGEEIRRVVPVVERLRARHPSSRLRPSGGAYRRAGAGLAARDLCRRE